MPERTDTSTPAIARHAVDPDGGQLSLVAYRVSVGPPLRLVPAPRERDWMEQTNNRFANRCLPLLMANQAGWFVLNSHPLTATWNGRRGQDALQIDYLDGDAPYPAVSHFGHGILTWQLPYLFRTPPGWNLLARGPSNWPKAGVQALDGLVETDWAVATFTMNWKLTEPGRPVTFGTDEPICMLLPQRRGDLEAFHPEIRTLAADPEIEHAYREWRTGRARFLVDLKTPASDAVKQAWQKDYFRGHTPNGAEAPTHQTKLRLRAFKEPAKP